ncbi:MAG: hypothetical protein HC877_15310 [Thioploca sp.]|nr:hypothetical protein [Thioploca sp.]
MQALREIHEVTSDTVTIQIPNTFPYKKVEIIVLPLEEKRLTDHTEDFWRTIAQFRQELKQSDRCFTDSVEFIREDREQ